MRVLIVGGTGMLGHKLVQVLGEQFETYSTIRKEYAAIAHFGIFPEQRTISNIEISTLDEVKAAIERVTPDVVINAVGIIKQLPSSKDVIQTLTANSIFPHRLAELSATMGFRLITISTDCVFSGAKGNYSESDPADALDLYGRSKHLGEIADRNIVTLRTSIIGRELGTAHSLVEWFLANRGKRVNGYINAIYSGFPTTVFADIISNLIVEHPNLTGLYHVSSEPINKFDLLNLVKKHFNLDVEIDPYEDFRIDRSLDSTRFRKATGSQPPSWPAMIEKMCADPTPYDKWKK
jgi:dTDP-4-dehydrorhamnose reductase